MGRLPQIRGLTQGSTTKGENEELRGPKRGIGTMDSGDLGRPGVAGGWWDPVEEPGRWCGSQEMNWKRRPESVRSCVGQSCAVHCCGFSSDHS